MDILFINFFYKNIKIYLYPLIDVIKIFMNIKDMNGHVIKFFLQIQSIIWIWSTNLHATCGLKN